MKIKKKRVFWIAIPLALVVIYFIIDSYTQKSIASIPGDFKEVAFVRNEQNKGGIIRIYAVTVGDISKANFDACARLFPINDYGSKTTVYFFDANKQFPTSLTLEAPHYDTNKYSAISIVKRNGR